MERTGRSVYEDGVEEETLDEEDVEMVDAETRDADADAGLPTGVDNQSAGGGGGDDKAAEGGFQGKNRNGRASKKKNKRKKKRKSGSAPNIMDINRFVIDTCRHLKEKKSYLVWNAVGCLGVSAVSDLVKEVDAIQGCGGQMTVDGKRSRTAGGILWNILKTREPKAYKEIMAKGREFEKQLWQPKEKQMTNRNEAAVSQTRYDPDETAGADVLDSSEHMPEIQQGLEPPDSDKGRISVHDRIIRKRVPVTYNDLFEEGEIHE